MIHALSDAGRRQLAAFLSRHPLLTFDIDGTLAPIVARPGDALIPEALQASMRALGAVTPIALLTGRGRADALRMAPFDCAYVLGNHGIEGLPGGEARMHALAATCAAWRATFDARALDAAGVGLEDKRYSLSLHYRHAPDHDAARRVIAMQTAALQPAPRLIDGKCVVNVLPPGAPDKGSALRELLAHVQSGCALYAGDDDTDEHVFDLPADIVLGIRVGRSARTQAALYVDDPDEMLPVVDLLRDIVAAR